MVVLTEVDGPVLRALLVEAWWTQHVKSNTEEPLLALVNSSVRSPI